MAQRRPRIDQRKALEPRDRADREAPQQRLSVMRLSGTNVRPPISVGPTGFDAHSMSPRASAGRRPRPHRRDLWSGILGQDDCRALHAVLTLRPPGGIAAFIDAEHARPRSE